MLKTIATEVVISKGYDGAPALKFSDNSVRFRVGKKVYDPRAEKNTRWINLSVKAFGTVCERIKKMQLKEGAFINMMGRLDEDCWEDPVTHEKKSAMVIVLDEVEYCYTGNKQSNASASSDKPAKDNYPTPIPPVAQNNSQPQAPNPMPQNFTGFQTFGGSNAFFDA